jgi:hypothetical protein
VAEDPAAAAETLPVAGFFAVAAAATGGDAGHQDPVALGDRGDGGADLGDGPDRLVAEHRSWLGLWDFAFEDVKVAAAGSVGVNLVIAPEVLPIRNDGVPVTPASISCCPSSGSTGHIDSRRASSPAGLAFIRVRI